MSEDLEVALDLGGATVEVGVARLHRRGNTITTDFTYDPAYISNPAAYAIDPALHLDAGRGVVDGLPGAFSDCAPDRWGRLLVDKRIQAARSSPGKVSRSVSDIDYLLGVSDLTRQGALRFRTRGGDEFLDPSTEVPKFLRLPELMRAADLVARDDDSDASAVKILLDAGSNTLGGARPKASVVADDGRLCIAKFPHHTDRWDVMAWEKTALDLAERAGVEVPRRRLVHLDGSTVLVLERFDRTGRQRVGYMSAMTLVQGQDGDKNRDYVELAAELSEASAAADADLAALWRRVAVSVAIHNTDDHFRNHGLLRGKDGWRLSPAFDINPNPDINAERSTSIGGAAARADELEGLILNADDFGLGRDEAAAVLTQVSEATRHWRGVALANGILEGQQKRFEHAFEGLRDQMDHLGAPRSSPARPTRPNPTRRARAFPREDDPEIEQHLVPGRGTT